MHRGINWSNMTATERKAEARRRRKVAARNKSKRLNGGDPTPEIEVEKDISLEGCKWRNEKDDVLDDREFLQSLLDKVKAKYLSPEGYWNGSSIIQRVALELYVVINENVT